MNPAPGWLADVEAALPAHLGAQRWFSGETAPDPASVRVDVVRQLWSAPDQAKRIWQILVHADDDCYQLLVGQRPSDQPAEFLHGHDNGLIAAADGSFFYDATLDAELSKELLAVVSGGKEVAQRSRPLSVEQSNTSLVFDERLILKIFRRLRPGANPDIEVTTALSEHHFEHVAEPLIHWRDGDYDLAFGQRYLAGGTDGWALALTSLRDLYNSRSDHPGDVGGDFAAEAERLGRVTAEMHVALSEAFPPKTGEGRAAGWRDLVEGLEGRLAAASEFSGRDLLSAAKGLVERLQAVAVPGPAVRVHGDYHLGQVMRTDSGWYVLDFEGEPARPVEERVRPTSVLKDVTGMLRSFHYASRHAIIERALPDWSDTEPLARSWESHNRQAFLDGYQSNPRIHDLLPDPKDAPAVMVAFELDKALYELGYERSHRPEWVAIPLDALDRLVRGDPTIGASNSG